MRVPDLTRVDGGIAHCKRLGLARKPGAADVSVDLTLVFPLDFDGDVDDAVDDLELPSMLEHARDVLRRSAKGHGAAKVQHDPAVEGRADLWVLVNDLREQLCANARAVARRVTLIAEQDEPRVVWLVRLEMPQATAGVLVGALESEVEVRFAPEQQELPLSSTPVGGPRAEA